MEVTAYRTSNRFEYDFIFLVIGNIHFSYLLLTITQIDIINNGL